MCCIILCQAYRPINFLFHMQAYSILFCSILFYSILFYIRKQQADPRNCWTVFRVVGLGNQPGHTHVTGASHWFRTSFSTGAESVSHTFCSRGETCPKPMRCPRQSNSAAANSHLLRLRVRPCPHYNRPSAWSPLCVYVFNVL